MPPSVASLIRNRCKFRTTSLRIGLGGLRLRRNFAIVTAMVIAVIVYGSLYPFTFRQPAAGLGAAARALFNSWAEAPGARRFHFQRGALYAIRLFAILAISGAGNAAKRILMVIVAGAILSTCMELAQYYDDSRQTAATDLYANVVGALLGAIGGSLTGGNFRWPLLREIASNRVPTLLLTAWAGYRLFPYVPTIDLHKYWNALKPVVLHPSLTGYDLFRYTAIWLTIGVLVEAIGGQKRAWLMFPLFVGSVIVAKVMIVDTTLTMAEVAGAGLAFCVWGILAVRTRLRVTLIALLFAAMSSPDVSNHSNFWPQAVLSAGSRFLVSCPALSRSTFYHFWRNFSFRQLDLAPHASRTSASVSHICRCGDPVHHQSSADLSAQPHGGDHGCRDGFAHRRGVRAGRRRDPTQRGLGSGAEEKSAGRRPRTRADKQAGRPDENDCPGSDRG